MIVFTCWLSRHKYCDNHQVYNCCLGPLFYRIKTKLDGKNHSPTFINNYKRIGVPFDRIHPLLTNNKTVSGGGSEKCVTTFLCTSSAVRKKQFTNFWCVSGRSHCLFFLLTLVRIRRVTIVTGLNPCSFRCWCTDWRNESH